MIDPHAFNQIDEWDDGSRITSGHGEHGDKFIAWRKPGGDPIGKDGEPLLFETEAAAEWALLREGLAKDRTGEQ